MDSVDSLAKRNHLLNAIPKSDMSPLLLQMVALFLNPRETVYRQGTPIQFIYFPVTAVLSMIASTSDGETVEVATVGSEGFVGVTGILGNPKNQGALVKVITQVPGSVIRVKADVFEFEMERNVELNRCVRRYLNVLFTQLVLSVGCNRLHSLEQRCARWLLSSMDRGEFEEIAVTQELLAELLGVRRQSVDHVLGELESKQIIECLRGSIKINDPKGLAAVACECYHLAKERLDNFLG